MRPVRELEALGYAITLEGENIHLVYKGEGEPDSEKILPLIEAVKRDKDEAIKWLKASLEERLDLLYLEVVDEVGKWYLPGMNMYTEGCYPELHQKIREAERRRDAVWFMALWGQGTVDDFQRALVEWRESLFMAFDAYSRMLEGEQVELPALQEESAERQIPFKLFEVIE